MGALAQVILQVAPDIIKLIQDRHAAMQPGAPVPTPAEIAAEFENEFTMTTLKDEMLKAEFKS